MKNTFICRSASVKVAILLVP